MNILNRKSNNINIATFWENFQLEKYNFDPSYQRKSDVWSESKKSFLMDTIFKNFPMPPIFLHQHIDTKTGKTVYDVIDGKQRLSAIISYINDEIPLPEDFSADEFGNSELNNTRFSELIEQLSDWKAVFWKYELTIEYIDTDQVKLVKNIFDRLNRNGEPLTAQELRHARFSETTFYKLIEKCTRVEFWQPMFERMERGRLEDEEFVSELLFVILEKQIFASDNRKVIDDLFEKYSLNKDLDQKRVLKEFNEISTLVKSFNLDVFHYQIYGVSHLYGLFGLAWVINTNKFPVKEIELKLNDFYSKLRNKEFDGNDIIQEYQKSMAAGTKSKSRRIMRINALLKYTGYDEIE